MLTPLSSLNISQAVCGAEVGRRQYQLSIRFVATRTTPDACCAFLANNFLRVLFPQRFLFTNLRRPQRSSRHSLVFATPHSVSREPANYHTDEPRPVVSWQRAPDSTNNPRKKYR